MIFNTSRKGNYDILLILLMLLFSHGLMIFLKGAWWDDLVIWNVDYDRYIEQQQTFNNPVLTYLYTYVITNYSLDNQFIFFRLISFVCCIITVLSVYVALRKIIGRNSLSFYASLLLSTCGINKCMPLICCLHYSISNSLFFLGLVFLVYDFYKPKFVYKILLSFLWLFSLIIWRSPALLMPFCTLVACYSIIDKKENSITGVFYEILTCLFKKYWYLLVVFTFVFILYSTIMEPKGSYASYYSISLTNIVMSPITTITNSIGMTLIYIGDLLKNLHHTTYLILFLLSISFLYFVLRKNDTDTFILIRKKYILYFLCLFAFFAILPQVLRGGIVFIYDIDGYKSRVASLMTVPISIFVAFVLIQIPPKIRQPLASVLIIASSLYSINTYLDYSKGWLKIKAFSAYLQSQEHLNGKQMYVKDFAKGFNVFTSENWRHYEYEGCARIAYGNKSKTKFIPSYYMLDEEFSPQYIITIEQKNEMLSKHIYLRAIFDDDYGNTISNNMLYCNVQENN